MWRGRVAPLNNLKYILKLLNNMQVNGFLKDKPSNFCCLTGKKFKEEEFNTQDLTVYPAYRFPSLNRAIAPRSANSAFA